MSPRKNVVTAPDSLDRARIDTAREMVALLDRIQSMLGTVETPPAPVETAEPPPAREKSRAFDGWKERRFTTSRRRIPSSMTPRLRSVLQFMIDAGKPVSDKQLSKDLNITIASARTALYHLRRNGFATMLPESRS